MEQYYEALVGTLKAAKRKGVIEFKGQLLLKGMHDHVLVSLVTEDQIKGADNETINDVKRLNREASKTKEESANQNNVKVHKAFTFSPPVCNNTNERQVGGNNDTSVEIKQESFQPSISYRKTEGRKKKTKKKKKKTMIVVDTNAKLELFSDEKESPIDKQQKKTNGDDASAVSFATAPAFGRSIKKDSYHSRLGSNDAIHTKSAGVTFHSVPRGGETHSERVERETNQLVNDIRRIIPEGEGFCAFGDLFEDSQVEQYYEALVGTLKAAKRKGMIEFKGQMLFKGMHDNVQIDIID